MDKSRIQLCIGPKTAEAPSFQYFEDLLRELAKEYGPTLYVDKKLAKKVQCGTFFIIKNNTYLRYLNNAVPINHIRKIIYLPIDRFSSLEEVNESKSQLDKINFMVINSPQLQQYFEDCPNVVYIPHHIKYYLKELPRYNPDSFVLWEGARTNLQYLSDWVYLHKPQWSLYVLTNGSPKEIHSLYFAHFKNVVCFEWSEHLMLKMLRKCKCVIDIKGDTFKQNHKPLTKAYQYLSSGVPFLTNHQAARLFFSNLNFDLKHIEYLISLEDHITADYWYLTQQFAPFIRELTNVKTVAKQYDNLIERCFA